MYICVSLPVNEPYQTLVSLHQYVLCGYDNVTFFFGGGGGGVVPDMPYRFGCEATDWLRGTWSPLKKISHLESLLSYWMEPPFFRYLKVQRLAIFSEQYTKYVFKTLRNIHFLYS